MTFFISVTSHAVGRVMIEIVPSITLNEHELRFEAVRSAGPGGQNVNKVNTAIQLRFDLDKAVVCSAEVKSRFIKLAGSRVTPEGICIIRARRFRSQLKNKQDALERVIKLLKKASVRPRSRIKTRPTREAIERRLAEKDRRSSLKKKRAGIMTEEV